MIPMLSMTTTCNNNNNTHSSSSWSSYWTLCTKHTHKSYIIIIHGSCAFLWERKSYKKNCTNERKLFLLFLFLFAIIIGRALNLRGTSLAFLWLLGLVLLLLYGTAPHTVQYCIFIYYNTYDRPSETMMATLGSVAGWLNEEEEE